MMFPEKAKIYWFEC